MLLPKVYEAVVRLGFSTDTCDASGRPVFLGDAAKVDEAAFDRALCSFLGTRMQIPPGISALKVNGRASHRTVRAGGESELRARPVRVTGAFRRSAVADGRAAISVTCGKGTYIRALARDIGSLLGCGAHIESLRRVSVGPFDAAGAQAPDELDLERLRPLREAGIPFQRVLLTADAERRLTDGLSVPLSEAGRCVPGTMELKYGLCVEGEALFGFAELESSGGLAAFLKPRTNIVI
jgi:tRNA pseudouridine(55) synthase